MSVEFKKIICPYDCPSTCGLIAEIENGKIIHVKNDPDHPVSKNGICRKMQHYEISINDPKRLLTPLKRTGKKGEGKFEPISWEEAIKEITDRWKEIIATDGAEAIWPWMYSGVMSDIQRNCGDAFFNRMGASELVKTLCSTAKGDGYKAVVGKSGCLDPEELNDSDIYFIWGSNMVATRMQTLVDLVKAPNKQKHKILIDTYANPTAKYCDDVILIKPGTDGALALAMMHVLEKEGYTDHAFLADYTEGYDTFVQTLDAYTPEWASEITGIAAEQIIELARIYGQAKAPAIILGSGNSRHRNGGMTVRLITILSLVTGAWKMPGGGLCGCTPIATSYVNMSLIARPDFRKTPARKLNINQMADALALTGKDQVKSVYIYAGNPMNTVSAQKQTAEGLLREDLFTVVHERFMTDTARYADIILPATFSVEQPDIYRAYGYCTLSAGPKVVEAPGECKSNWDVFALLAEAMGYEEDYFKQTEEEMFQMILANPTEAVATIDDEKKLVLEQGGGIRMSYSDHIDFETDTKKAKIVNEAMAIAVPVYLPVEDDSYPFHLVAAPSAQSLNSTFLDRDDLMNARGGMYLIMHSEDAKERQIMDGSKILVWNELAEVEMIAKVTDQIARKTVVAEGVYTSTQSLNGWTINALTHTRLSDIGAATTLNDNRVDIRAL